MKKLLFAALSCGLLTCSPMLESRNEAVCILANGAKLTTRSFVETCQNLAQSNCNDINDCQDQENCNTNSECYENEDCQDLYQYNYNCNYYDSWSTESVYCNDENSSNDCYNQNDNCYSESHSSHCESEHSHH